MHRILLAFAATATAATATLISRSAGACSQPSCIQGRFTPGDGVTVPANLPAIHWRPTISFGTAMPDPSLVTLATTTDPTTPLAFTATALPGGDYLLVPDQSLVAGTSYIVKDGKTCGQTPGPSVTFTAGPTAPRLTQLGTLTAVAANVSPLTVPTGSGSCTTNVSADQATVDLALAPEAMPWLHAMLFETVVDGTVWRSQASVDVSPWTGIGVDRIYHVCATSDPGASLGLDAGSHDVTLRASLPGSTTVVTSTVAAAVLQCDEVPPATCQTDPSMCEEPGGCCSTSNRAPDASWLLVALGALVRRRRALRIAKSA